MEIIYKTIDGKLFTNEGEARAHEKSLIPPMWDACGRSVDKTCAAWMFYAKDEDAVKQFIALAKNQNDEDIAFIDDVEYLSRGFYIWDEEELAYRYLSKTDAKHIAEIYTALAENGEL